MKSYEEMTDSVLARAKVKKAVHKRRSINAVIVASLLCIVGVSVFAGRNAESHVKGGTHREPRISLFCVTANAEQQRQQMLKDEKLPYCAVLRVHDVAGLSELEKLELRTADKEYIEQMSRQNTDDYGKLNWSTTSYANDKVMVTSMFAGSFYLSVDDYKQIRDVSATTSEFGYFIIHGSDYHDAAAADGVGVTWGLSGEGIDMITKNPQMKLSEITDTIVVTVEFNDGTKDVVTIDIELDDAGQIYGIFRGIAVIG